MISPIDFIAKNLPNHKIDIFGRNSLMFTSVPYYFYSILVILLAFWPTHSPTLLFVIYGLIPLFDQLFSYDERNPNEKERKILEKDPQFTMALYIHILVDWICFFKIIEYFSTFEFTINSVLGLILTIFAFGSLQAAQFAIAHEVFHRTDIFNRMLGTLHMSKNLYMHFTYNHLYIHHKRVSTPEDPASAQKNITLYQFFPRTFFGSYQSVYHDQKEKKIPLYMNYAVLSILEALTFPLIIGYFYGIQAAILFSISAFISILYLEGINYIEHYGLRRKKLPDGNYQKTTIMHSWNAPHRVSNYLLFKLQRHSDHHENCLKHYQTLTSLPQSPLLPHGYTLMIILSFVPNKFFEIMNPLLENFSKQKDAELKYHKAEVLAKRFMVESFILFGIIAVIGQSIKMMN